jgi:hypothetical protein
MTNAKDLNRYAASGMAAFLPGMQYMVELMQRQLDEFRAQLAIYQHGEAEAVPQRKQRKGSSGGKTYWSKLSPEERSEEMQRRHEVRQIKTRKLIRMKAARTRWDRMTKAQRQEWQAKMVAGKKKNKKDKKTPEPKNPPKKAAVRLAVAS